MGIAAALDRKSLRTNRSISSDQVHLAQLIIISRTTTGTMRKHNNHNNAPNIASMIAFVLLATSFKSVSATYTYIAGYEPRSTVTEHAEIDLDVKDIMTHDDWPSNNGGAYKDCTTITNACKWDTNMYPTLWDTACTHSGATVSTSNACKSPYGIYSAGKNSLKKTSVRSIAGFASSIGTKESGPIGAKVAAKDNQFIGAMNNFWKSKGLNELTWGQDIIEAAFKGEKVNGGRDLVIPTTEVTTSTNTIKFDAHGLSDGDSVQYNNGGGTAITGLTHGTNYFVVNKDTNTFKLSASSGGSAIALSGQGNDNQYFTPKHNFDFGVVGRDFRKEVIQKGMIYLNIFPYVIWEMQDAINDCNAGSLADNTQSYCSSSDTYCGQSVHAWDEAVAFFAGSLESVTKGGVTGYSGGYLQYYLADKRCENFGTCTASYDTNADEYAGESKVNEEIIALFQRGEDEISAAVDITSTTSAAAKTKCDVPAKTMEEVATKMLVPFIQGTIRYLYKTQTTSGRTAKQAGELFAFASTILPFIHAADPAAAKMLYTHVWEMPADPANDVNTLADIKSAIEATYPKLGFGAGIGTIKCSDIGQLGSPTEQLLGGCVDTVSSTIEDYAGYEPITDVTMHSRIDLDLEEITTAANIGETCDSSCKLSYCSVATTVMADGTDCNYDGTTLPWPTSADGSFDIWTNGEHSKKSTSMRTIRGFVSGAKTKASGNSPSTQDVAYKDNKFIAIMNKYWKSKNLDEHTWGEQMIKAAFEGTKVGSNTHLDFSTVGRDFRKEAIQKGIVYTNIFPYVIWEMQDAVNDCLALAGTNNDDKSVHAWDEAVAFYAGSKTRGKGYGILESEAGKLQYRLADKRCINFKTCANGFSGTSNVNQDIFALFNLGKEEAKKSAVASSTADCVQLNTLKEKISTLSLVPFVQGTLRYLYKTRNDDSGRSAKQVGELWAFATAILPFVAEADANAAEMLYRRAWQLDFTSNSYEEIKSALEATYPKLGAGAGVGLVTCEAVGDLYGGNTDDTLLSAGTCYPSTSSSKDEVDVGLAAGLGVVAFVFLVATFV